MIKYLCATALTTGLVTVSIPAIAQTAVPPGAAAPGTELEEIVVTAQKEAKRFLTSHSRSQPLQVMSSTIDTLKALRICRAPCPASRFHPVGSGFGRWRGKYNDSNARSQLIDRQRHSGPLPGRCADYHRHDLWHGRVYPELL